MTRLPFSLAIIFLTLFFSPSQVIAQEYVSGTLKGLYFKIQTLDGRDIVVEENGNAYVLEENKKVSISVPGENDEIVFLPDEIDQNGQKKWFTKFYIKGNPNQIFRTSRSELFKGGDNYSVNFQKLNKNEEDSNGKVFEIRGVQTYLPLKPKPQARGAGVIAQIPLGGKVQEVPLPAGVATSPGWKYVRFKPVLGDSIEGWVVDSDQFLKELSGSKEKGLVQPTVVGFAEPIKGIVKLCDPESYLNARAGPGPEYIIEGNLDCDAEIQIYGKDQRTGWYKVDVNGEMLWVASEFLEVEPSKDEILELLNEKIPDSKKIQEKLTPADDCEPNQSGDAMDQPCITYDPRKYTGDAAREWIDTHRNVFNPQRGCGPSCKGNFFDYFAPLAVMIQDKTGYPASVMLAQMAKETSWGSSRTLRGALNIGGISCFKENSTWETRKLVFDKETIPIAMKCDYKRPRSETAYYRSFKALSDSALYFAWNLLKNPNVRSQYRDIRAAVNARQKGAPASQNAVLSGLENYATDPNYIPGLSNLIGQNDLEKFNEKTICR